MAVIQIQWFVWGYSLTYSSTASPFIGNLANAGFHNVFTNDNSSSTVSSAYNSDVSVETTDPNNILGKAASIYSSMYISVTAVLMIGAVADRGRVIPAMVFLFVWGTIVYAPITCWSWNANGWLAKLGYLDYAGGTPVHITAGYGALAYSMMLGRRTGMDSVWSLTTYWNNWKRRRQQKDNQDMEMCESSEKAKSGSSDLDTVLMLNDRPHSVMFVVIGTALMWAGWTGFNGGASIIPTLRTLQAVVNTNVSAAAGGITWVILDYRISHKWSVIGFCSGVISGLVAITPGAGFVPLWSALIYGVVGGLSANISTKLKFVLGVDDALDIFAVHGVCGVAGNILTALFASKTVAALDTLTTIPGGWIDHHYVQLWYQIAGTLASSAYAFFVTALLLFIINKIPGLQLRMTREEEAVGIDDAEHGEFAYDYVELIPDLPYSQEEVWPMVRPQGNGSGGGALFTSDQAEPVQFRQGLLGTLTETSESSSRNSSPAPSTNVYRHNYSPGAREDAKDDEPDYVPQNGTVHDFVNKETKNYLKKLLPRARRSSEGPEEPAEKQEDEILPEDPISNIPQRTPSMGQIMRPSLNRQSSSGIVPLLRRGSDNSEDGFTPILMSPTSVASPTAPSFSSQYMMHRPRPHSPELTTRRVARGDNSETSSNNGNISMRIHKNSSESLNSLNHLQHLHHYVGGAPPASLLYGNNTSNSTPGSLLAHRPSLTAANNYSPTVPSSLRRISHSGGNSSDDDDDEEDSVEYKTRKKGSESSETPYNRIHSQIQLKDGGSTPNDDDDDDDDNGHKMVSLLGQNQSQSTFSSYMLDGENEK